MFNEMIEKRNLPHEQKRTMNATIVSNDVPKEFLTSLVLIETALIRVVSCEFYQQDLDGSQRSKSAMLRLEPLK
jgi:hypothetical protein